jgi:hypothetical protein
VKIPELGHLERFWRLVADCGEIRIVKFESISTVATEVSIAVMCDFVW